MSISLDKYFLPIVCRSILFSMLLFAPILVLGNILHKPTHHQFLFLLRYLLSSLQHQFYSSGLISIESVSAQVKGGLSVSCKLSRSKFYYCRRRSRKHYSRSYDRWNLYCFTYGWLTMTMSPQYYGRTNNATNLTFTQGGLSVSSSIDKAEK